MTDMAITWLRDGNRPDFPPVQSALRQPNGLLAAGGQLSIDRLEAAYRRGIFPWYEEGQPVLWWSPDPRTLLYPHRLHVSRSLCRRLRRNTYRVTLDCAFDAVMRECAAPRAGQRGTWITDDMVSAYSALHRLGRAHSVEVWNDDALVGGLYGVSLGRAFFGESMFSRRDDGSKIALVWLVRQLHQWGFRFLDCQVGSSHLYTLGAADVCRERFIAELHAAIAEPGPEGPHWHFDAGFHPLGHAP